MSQGSRTGPCQEQLGPTDPSGTSLSRLPQKCQFSSLQFRESKHRNQDKGVHMLYSIKSPCECSPLFFPGSMKCALVRKNEDRICHFQRVCFRKNRAHTDLKYYLVVFPVPAAVPCTLMLLKQKVYITKRTFSLPNTPALNPSALQNTSYQRILLNQISKVLFQRTVCSLSHKNSFCK